MASAAPPGNDAREGALTFTGIAAGNNAEATVDMNDPAGAGSHTVWYRSEIGSSTKLRADTCGSAIDTKLTLVDSGGTTIAQDDDGCAGSLSSSLTTASAVPAGTYFLVVGTYQSTPGGDFSLKGGRVNDDYLGAQDVSSGFTASTNVGASTEVGEPIPAGRTPSHSVWFRWVPTSTGEVTIDTCSTTGTGSMTDTLLGVYTGGSITNANAVASNDDAVACGTPALLSRVTVAVSQGTVYRIQVDGFAGQEGSFTLSINAAGPGPGIPPQADTTSATGITSAGATLNGTVTRSAPTDYRFEYGRTSAYGSQTSRVALGTGAASVPVSSDIGGLQSSSSYHYRVVAYNANGIAEGPDMTFTTASVSPTAVNDSKIVDEDSSATQIDVLANDTDPDGGPKQVVGKTNGLHGSVVLDAGAELTYQPDPNYCNTDASGSGSGPDDTFSYTLNGGSEATVSVAVTCLFDPPPPDSDGDGVPDSSDACPSQAGPVSNNGCPVPPPPNGETAPAPPSDGGSTPPPSGGSVELSRTLSIAYSAKKDAFGGRLVSQSDPCIASQKISVFETKKGRDPKVGSSTTTEIGKYSLKEKNAQGSFYAKIAQTSSSGGTCLAARSKAIKVG